MKLEFKFTQHFLNGEIRTDDKFLELIRDRANEIMTKCKNIPTMRSANAAIYAVTKTGEDGMSHTESVRLQVRENSRTQAQIEQITVCDSYRNKEGVLENEISDGMIFDLKEKTGKYIHTKDRYQKTTHSFKYYAVPFVGRKIVSNIEKEESPLKETIKNF